MLHFKLPTNRLDFLQQNDGQPVTGQCNTDTVPDVDVPYGAGYINSIV